MYPLFATYVWYVIHTFHSLQTATLQRKQHSKIRHQHTLYKERQLRLKIMVNGWCVILVWKKRKKKRYKTVLLAHYVFTVYIDFSGFARSLCFSLCTSGVCVIMPKLTSPFLLCFYCFQECGKCRAAELDSGQGITFKCRWFKPSYLFAWLCIHR